MAKIFIWLMITSSWEKGKFRIWGLTKYIVQRSYVIKWKTGSLILKLSSSPEHKKTSSCYKTISFLLLLPIHLKKRKACPSVLTSFIYYDIYIWLQLSVSIIEPHKSETLSTRYFFSPYLSGLFNRHTY